MRGIDRWNRIYVLCVMIAHVSVGDVRSPFCCLSCEQDIWEA